MTAQLRIAAVGAGYFSAFHRDSWDRIDRAKLVAVCDRDADRAAATGYPAFSDLEAMLDRIRPDVLDIAVPPAAHADTIRAALDAGIPAVICQKPFCTGLDEAARMTELAASEGTRLVVHENFRFQPWYRAIRRALRAGDIGTPLQATFWLRPGDGQGPDAYLDRQPYFQDMPRFLIHETGVHWIDTFRFLFGEPGAVYADLRKINPAIAGEDAGHVLFDHPGGLRALFDGNRLLDHAAEDPRRTMGEARIEGTGGTLALDGSGAVTMRRFGAHGVRTLLAAQDWPGFGGDCVHALQCHVVEGLLDGAPLENEAADYLPVIRIEEAVYRSAGEGRKIALAG